MYISSSERIRKLQERMRARNLRIDQTTNTRPDERTEHIERLMEAASKVRVRAQTGEVMQSTLGDRAWDKVNWS